MTIHPIGCITLEVLACILLQWRASPPWRGCVGVSYERPPPHVVLNSHYMWLPSWRHITLTCSIMCVRDLKDMGLSQTHVLEFLNTHESVLCVDALVRIITIVTEHTLSHQGTWRHGRWREGKDAQHGVGHGMGRGGKIEYHLQAKSTDGMHGMASRVKLTSGQHALCFCISEKCAMAPDPICMADGVLEKPYNFVGLAS